MEIVPLFSEKNGSFLETFARVSEADNKHFN
jgi:hypothetical protein